MNYTNEDEFYQLIDNWCELLLSQKQSLLDLIQERATHLTITFELLPHEVPTMTIVTEHVAC